MNRIHLKLLLKSETNVIPIRILEASAQLWRNRGIKKEYGHSLLSILKRKTVTGIKEELCYISLDFNKEIHDKDHHREKDFHLLDGQQITLDQERFLCPEPMFKPKMLLDDSSGLHSLAFSSILKAPETFRSKTLYRVALSGGSTMFPCFPERIRNELVCLAPEDYPFQVMASPRRINSTW
uniref:Actin, cytoskeletal 3-like n=1 Tax=Geotrypetes seraphini TaxID=260995 RepID=A0A6P8S8G8_GEOSA|nr:actin, cytoskeletal 3-like [Geotrypetes seraphini]